MPSVVFAYEGNGGSGKTLCAVEVMLGVMAKGGGCSSNIKLNWPECVKWVQRRYGVTIHESQHVALDDSGMANFVARTPAGTKEKPWLVVLDEIHFWFNSRDTHTKAREMRDLFNFLTVARHYHTQILFISQHLDNVDIQFRRLMGSVFRFKDFEDMRIPGIGVRWGIPNFLRTEYDATGRHIVRWKLVGKDKSLYACYESYNQVQAFDRLEHKMIGPTRLTWKERVRPRMKAILVVGFLLVVGLVVAVPRIVKGITGQVSSAAKPAASATSAAAVPRVPPIPDLYPPVIDAVTFDGQGAVLWVGGRRLRPGERVNGFQVAGLTSEGVEWVRGTNVHRVYF